MSQLKIIVQGWQDGHREKSNDLILGEKSIELNPYVVNVDLCSESHQKTIKFIKTTIESANQEDKRLHGFHEQQQHQQQQQDELPNPKRRKTQSAQAPLIFQARPVEDLLVPRTPAIFLYGRSGSGKTTTLFAGSKKKRLVQLFFHGVAAEALEFKAEKCSLGRFRDMVNVTVNTSKSKTLIPIESLKKSPYKDMKRILQNRLTCNTGVNTES